MRNSKTLPADKEIDIKNIILKLRRLTAGKGRIVIEISNLPENDKWCKELTSNIKKSLGTTGTYKNGKIEIHGEIFDRLSELLSEKNIKWKKTGG